VRAHAPLECDTKSFHSFIRVHPPFICVHPRFKGFPSNNSQSQ
jgi:hypothetical protein